jgi:hypothetical protein
MYKYKKTYLVKIQDWYVGNKTYTFQDKDKAIDFILDNYNITYQEYLEDKDFHFNTHKELVFDGSK